MATRQGLSAENNQGQYDKGSQGYSDTNAPGSLEMTLATEPPSPPSGETVLWSVTGKTLLLKAPDGTVTTLGGSSAATGTKVSALTAVTAPNDTDYVYLVSGGASRRITLNDMTAYFEARARRTNAAVASVTGYASDTYLVGSNVLIPSGRLQARSMYRLKFKITKTAAGTATPIVTVRFGTAGTTSDAALTAVTFAAQTAVVDSGLVEIFCTFRAVGTSTSAVLHSVGTLEHQLTATGLSTLSTSVSETTSSGFNSTLASAMIGASVNGGTSAAWTISMVQAELMNLA